MATWHPTVDEMVFEHHHGTDENTTMLNHKTGTATASLVGTWTGGVGFMDITGTSKAMNYNYALLERFGHIAVIVKPNGLVGVCASAGSNGDLTAQGICLFGPVNPAPGDTVTLNGQTVTFVSGLPVGFQVQIMGTPELTAYYLAALINANPATFGMSANCPAYNKCMELTSLTAGVAGNSIGIVSGSSAVRFINTTRAFTSTLVGGAAGETVSCGIVTTSVAFNGRNSMIGTGGIASINHPSNAFYYVTLGLTRRDFPELCVFASGTLLSRSIGTGSGRVRSQTAMLKSGDNAALGGQSCTIGYAAAWNKRLTDAENLAGYLAVRAEKNAEVGGITVT
jgi:hypothetical protein